MREWRRSPAPAGWEHQRLTEQLLMPSGQVDPRREPYRSMVLVAPDHIESQTGRLLMKVTAREQGAISGKYLFRPGDILYSKIRPYLRKAFLADFDGICSADMYPLRPADGELCSGFLKILLLGEHFSRFAEIVSMRSGFPKINREELAEYIAAIPPPCEQRSIVEILDTLDAAIEQTERLTAKLRQMKQGLLHDLLTRGIDDNGELRDPERYPEQFRDSPLGPVPRGWSVQSIASVCPTIVDYRGVTPPYTRSGVPVISQEDVQSDGLRPTTKWVSEQTADRWTYRGRLESGDVVFRMERFIGEVIQVPTGRRRVITRGVLALRPDPTVSSKGFLFWSLFKRKRDDGWGIHGHATTVPRMYKPDLLDADFAFPSVAEQARITAVLDAHEGRLQGEIAAVAKLRTLKHGLMHDLLTGRVRVEGAT